MKFNVSLLIVALAKISRVDAAVFDMKLDPVGSVRTDPILDSNCLSDHVHTFYGSKALFPSTRFADLRNVDAMDVSGNIVENKSLYWHPAVYHQLTSGKWELLQTKLAVYYIWDTADPNVRAFTPNFAMIAGGTKIDQKAALTFECDGQGTSYNSFPSQPCSIDDEFFVEFKMPNCWNGQLRDSEDSHVAYSLEGGNEQNDPCPPGFFKIPQIWLFIEFPNGYPGGNVMFSDGTQVLHVDYFNGWDEMQLQNALTNCRDTVGVFDPIGGTRCPQQFHYKNDILGLGEDVEYSPENPFDTTLITDEAITNVNSPPRKSPNTSGGVCDSKDQPKPLAGASTPGPTSPPTPAPTPNPTPAPTADTSPGTPPPTPNPTLRSTPPPTPNPTPNPTPQSTPRPTPNPTAAPMSSNSCVANCDEVMDGDIDDVMDCLLEFCEEGKSDYQCAENCIGAFFVCEHGTDATCHDSVFMLECVVDCQDEHSGSDDDIEDCIDEFCVCDEDWCIDDQDACYEAEDQKCIVERVTCLSAC